jgi:hypothetical protein
VDINYLHQAIAAVCPIDGISIGNPADKATWVIHYQASATSAQQTAAQSLVAGWNAAAVNPLSTFAAAQAAGAAVTSTSTPAINGTYGCMPQDEINMTALQTALNSGVAWIGYLRDINGVAHSMTAAQFTSLVTAILGYMVALDAWLVAALGGSSAAPPSNALTIP